MVRRTGGWAVALGLLLVSAVPALAQAQEDGEGITYCGEEDYGVQLRNHNPDLNPWNDPVPEDHPYHDSDQVPDEAEGLVESSWHLFNQFQAVVDVDHPEAPPLNPEKQGGIKSWWFGFGPLKDQAVIEGAADCEKPWTPGIQLYSYRSDATPEDGFFVPINTTGVPDGTYGYVLYACTERAYDACQPTGVDDPETGEPRVEDNLVAAVWGKATVYNGREHCEEGGLQGTPLANHDLSCMRTYDFVEPWPMVLPGDGTQTNEDACDVSPQRCLTVEFGEDLATVDGSQAPDDKAVRVWYNGVEVTDELEAWTPPARDNDLIPGNDGPHTGHPASNCEPLAPAQDQLPSDARACQKVVWGDGFSWSAPSAFRFQDEIRVWAEDGAGNQVEKTISFEDETRGAVIPLIEGELEVHVTPARKQIRPGDAKTFNVTVENTGNDTLHTFPTTDATEGLDVKLSDDHVDVAGGANRTVELVAAPAENASEGDYGAEVVFEYISGQRRVEKKAFATVEVAEDAELSTDARSSREGDGSAGPTGQAPGEGFNRTCSTQADLQVCSVYPDPLEAGEPFTFEVQVQRAGEEVEERHEFSAGNASLTVSYLDADGDEEVAEAHTVPMEEVDNGVYRAEVTLQQRAPMIHVTFDSEKVKVQQMVKRPQPSETDQDLIPALGPPGVAVAVGAAGLVAARRSGRTGRGP